VSRHSKGDTNMTNVTKYAEIIARRKAERAADEDDKPVRFKLVKTVDGGTAVVRA
jgi:hypothetical protein